MVFCTHITIVSGGVCPKHKQSKPQKVRDKEREGVDGRERERERERERSERRRVRKTELFIFLIVPHCRWMSEQYHRVLT